jgi:hypothetical protein
MLPYGSESSGPAFAIPHGIVLFIGGMCFIVFLTEGAALDWSAVFLAQERGIDTAYAGLGYAAFALTMTAGRLMGDRIVRTVGATRIILFGGLLAAAGLFLATFAPSWEAALVGYALVGAGCSNIVPVLYTAVGKQTVMPESIAVPAISTPGGCAGILAGPAVIGFVAHASSLVLRVDGAAVGGRRHRRQFSEVLNPIIVARELAPAGLRRRPGNRACCAVQRQQAPSPQVRRYQKPTLACTKKVAATTYIPDVVAGAGEILLVEDVFTPAPASGSTPAARSHTRRARSRSRSREYRRTARRPCLR